MTAPEPPLLGGDAHLVRAAIRSALGQRQAPAVSAEVARRLDRLQRKARRALQEYHRLGLRCCSPEEYLVWAVDEADLPPTGLDPFCEDADPAWCAEQRDAGRCVRAEPGTLLVRELLSPYGLACQLNPLAVVPGAALRERGILGLCASQPTGFCWRERHRGRCILDERRWQLRLAAAPKPRPPEVDSGRATA